MSQKATISQTGPGQLAVSGDLKLDTVAGLYRDSLQFAGQDPLPSVVDLSQVADADSAGLALLLEWQSWARRREHRFQFENTPPHLMQLAELSEAQCLLDLKRCEQN